MALFAVICLVIALIGIHHLLFWLWREIIKLEYQNEGQTMFGVICSVIVLFTSFLIVYYIIEWGQELL